MIFHALIALVVSVIILDGCDGGVNYKYLKTPESVVTSKKGQAEAQFSNFATAMSQAVKEPFVPHEETIKRDEEILDILNVIEKQTSAPRSLGSINTIKSALSNIKSKEESDDLKKHLEIVSELTELIKPHNAGGTLVINVRAEGSEGKEIAEKFDKALKMRLMQELLYVSSAVLKPLGEAADKSFAASLAMLSKMPKDSPDLAIAERIKPLIEFLKTASDPSEIDASIIFSYKSSLPMVLELTDAIKELSLVEEKTAIINNLQPLIADKVAQLNILENAFIGLNPALNTYLKDILVPSSLGYKVSSEANKNPLGQVEEEIKKAVKTISFALPNDSELAVYSDYLSLVGNNVFTLDLLKLSLSAKATQLIAKDFVKWADLIINDDIAKNSVQRPVVLLTGVSALDYDTNLDETSRKKAQAANFTLLAELVKEVTLLAPLELKDQSLFANSVAAKKSQIIIDPLNLELAEKIITKLIQNKNMLEPGMKWRAEPLIAMAKIYKAFRPNKFYLGELISITEEYWQQRRLKGGAGLSEKDEMKLALQIIENKLNINSSEISQSRVLAYTSAAIEEKLASNFEKDYFTNSAHKGKIRQAAQDIQVMLAGVSDLQTKLSEAKKFADQVKNTVDKLDVSKLEALALKAKQLSSEIERLSKSANLDNMNKLKSDAEKIKQEIDDIVNNITKSTKLVDLKNSVDEANKLKIEFDKIDIDPTKLEKKLKEAEELEKKFTKLNINPDKLEEQYNKAKKFFDDFNILKINPSNLENEYNKAKKFVDDFKLLSIDPKELAKNLKAAEKILADFKKINIDPTGLNSKLENAKKIKKAFDEIKIDPTDLNNKLTIAKKIVEDYNNLKIDEMAEKANKVLETANEAETKYNNIKEELDKLAIGFDSFAKWKESNDKLLEKINKFFGDGESEPEAITKLREAIRIKNEAIDKNLKNINKVLTDPDTGLEKRFSDASLLLSSLDKYINGTDPLTDPGIKGKIKEIDTNVEYLESARKIIYNDVYAKEVGLRDQLIKAKRELTSSAKSSADIVEMMRILIVGLYKNNMLDKWFVTDKNKKQQELQQEFSKAVKLLIEAGVTIDQGKDKLDFN